MRTENHKLQPFRQLAFNIIFQKQLCIDNASLSVTGSFSFICEKNELMQIIHMQFVENIQNLRFLSCTGNNGQAVSLYTRFTGMKQQN